MTIDNETTGPPTTVRMAFRLQLAIALISVVAMINVLVGNGIDKPIMEAAGRGGMPDGLTAQQALEIAKGVAVGAGVVLLGVYLFFVFKMRAGRNWARLVLAVTSLLTVVTVSQTGSVKVDNRVYSATMSLVSGWIGAALALLALIFMFLSASNWYFRQRRTVPSPPLRSEP